MVKKKKRGKMRPQINRRRPDSLLAILQKLSLHTVASKINGLRGDILTLEGWCQNSIRDREERITSAFATHVDMIDNVEERTDDVEKLYRDQKETIDSNMRDIK